MDDDPVTPIETLASLLQSADAYGFERLKAGLLAERRRLGANPYLVTLWLSDLGYDGFTDSISLGDSYQQADEAIAEATQWVHSVRNNYLMEARADWTIDPDRGLSSTMPFGKGVEIFYQEALGLAAGFYNHIYICARVLGPFRGTIVDRPLLGCFENTKEELRSHLLSAAGASSPTI